MPEITHTGQQAVQSISGGLAFEQDNDRIIGRENSGLPRLLILADGTQFVMKVSEEGVDVTTATDSQLIFNSGQNILQVAYSDSIIMPTQQISSGNSVTRSVTAPFPLQAERPAIIAYGKGAGSSLSFFWAGTKLLTWGVGAGTGVTIYRAEVYEMDIGQSSVTFTAEYLNGDGAAATAQTYTITYYVMQQSISGA